VGAKRLVALFKGCPLWMEAAAEAVGPTAAAGGFRGPSPITPTHLSRFSSWRSLVSACWCPAVFFGGRGRG